MEGSPIINPISEELKAKISLIYIEIIGVNKNVDKYSKKSTKRN